MMDFSPALPLLLSMLLLFRQNVGALELKSVSVPPYVRKGEHAQLECCYDLGTDKLYSVTWYKDNEHIYSYKATESIKQQVFAVIGVQINRNNSNSQTLQLLHVNLNTTGNYSCEVSTNTIPFKTVKGEAYLEVIEPTTKNPEITGEEKIYATGDILALNCTSGFSYPAAQLQWFINDVPVNPDLEVLHLTFHGLHSTRSSLRLELNPLHLSEGKIVVKCVSTVRTSHLVKMPFVDVRTTKIYVQGHGSLSTPSISLLLGALLLLSLPKKN